MASESWKKSSRIDWHSESKNDVGFLSVDHVKAGALMRIADVTEMMAKNHDQLVRDAENNKRWYQEEKQRREKLQRSNAALRGIIKRMKRKASNG